MLHSVTCIRVTRNMYHIVTPSLTQTSPPHNACYTVKHKATCFCVTFTTSSHFLNTHLHCTTLDSSVLHCHIVQCPCHNPLKKKRATKVASDLWSADPTIPKHQNRLVWNLDYNYMWCFLVSCLCLMWPPLKLHKIPSQSTQTEGWGWVGWNTLKGISLQCW